MGAGMFFEIQDSGTTVYVNLSLVYRIWVNKSANGAMVTFFITGSPQEQNFSHGLDDAQLKKLLAALSQAK